MEELLIRLAVSGGPSAVIMAGGLFWLNFRIRDVQNDVAGKRWTETCDTKHTEVDRRLDRLEKVMNGAIDV